MLSTTQINLTIHKHYVNLSFNVLFLFSICAPTYFHDRTMNNYSDIANNTEFETTISTTKWRMQSIYFSNKIVIYYRYVCLLIDKIKTFINKITI